MRPKGSQFLFDPSEFDSSAIKESRRDKASIQDKADVSSNTTGKRGWWNRPLARSSQPFSAVDEGQEWYGTSVGQDSLPAGMKVRSMEYGAEGFDQGRGSVRKEVPYTQLSTFQAPVQTNRLNDVWNNINVPSQAEKLNQATKGSGQHVPLVNEFKNPDGSPEYVLRDGNHRSTVENHRGALFHQVDVAVKASSPPPPQIPGDRNMFGREINKGRFDL